MMKIKKVEHDSKNPRGWEILVGYALAPLCLEKVIDSSVPRPTKGHPKYTRWIFWSRMVASWMYTQVDETLQERIQHMAHRPQYADDMMDKLMTMVQGSDKADNTINEIMKFDKI
ncbi:hypothetical protein N7465_004876 [Penicillium sp. CMV-2018d]|nr:hypothetical protein N7465_004876 [Penicillium sp. CMV-2018d]